MLARPLITKGFATLAILFTLCIFAPNAYAQVSQLEWAKSSNAIN